MIFKKKPKISEEDKKILEKLDAMKEYVRQLQSDLNFGLINQNQYEVRIHPILVELREMEQAKNIETFDEMMGHPMEWMDELFRFEDKAVKEIENEE